MFQTAFMNFSSTVDLIAFGGGPFGGSTPLGAIGAMAPAAVRRAAAGGGIDGAFIWLGATGTAEIPLPERVRRVSGSKGQNSVPGNFRS